MSNLINCQKLTKSFGNQILFSEIDFLLNTGDRVGIVGPNGSGKSTLLKIICGLEELDSGNILKRKQMSLSYLAQDDFLDEESSVVKNMEAVLEGSALEDTEKYNRIHSVLSRAEFYDPEVTVKTLSGGWRKRLAVCQALVSYPDVLVMDEPTNHLDIEGIIWLEKLFAGGFQHGPKAYILVSHDRRFLENCTNKIVELSAVYPDGLLQVDGSYGKFLEQRKTFLALQNEQETRLANKVRRETEWLRRGPKARTSKAQYRIDEAHRLTEQLGEVRSRNRAVSSVKINFDSTGRKTKKLLEAKGLGKGFEGRMLFSNLDMTLKPGTRLGLLGRNGCGKSTLMNVLASSTHDIDIELDAGRLIPADGLRIVRFDQHRQQVDQQQTLRRALSPDGDSIVYQGRSIHVVSWAKRFLFSPDQLETPVAQLSGGEQARILIAQLIRQPADILLLDEPTNDLDINSLDVLEESLLDFPGALVLVSHDRFLLDRICDSVLGFDGHGGTEYYADYRQWLDALDRKEQGKACQSPKTKEERDGKKKKRPGKLSYMDQRDYDTLEERILVAEELRDKLHTEIESPEVAGDPVKLEQHWNKLQECENEIEALYDRWNELETILEEK